MIKLNKNSSATPAIGEISMGIGGEILVYDGTNFIPVYKNSEDDEHFMNTPKGQERLKEMFMEWMNQNYPEDLL